MGVHSSLAIQGYLAERIGSLFPAQRNEESKVTEVCTAPCGHCTLPMCVEMSHCTVTMCRLKVNIRGINERVWLVVASRQGAVRAREGLGQQSG